MAVFLLIVGLLLFVGLVVVHEFGHFIMARRGGVDVEEFGIGFPPEARVITKKNGTKYTLNWLPLGGFVKLKGENDADTAPGSYGAARLSTKVKIMLAGVGMNLLTAFVLLTFLALFGMPNVVENQFTVASDTHVTKQQVLVATVEEGGPADKAGLKARDQLLEIGDTGLACGIPDACHEFIKTAEDLPKQTQAHAGQTTSIIVKRDGVEHSLRVSLRTTEEVEASKKTNDPKGYLGISPTEYIVQRSTWSAPIVAAGFIKQATELTFKGLGTAVSGLSHGDTAKASAGVRGPVGIFVLLKDGSVLGVEFILLIIAIISLTLAIMNILPIPALDGGRLFVTLLFRAMHKPLTKQTEDRIHGTGFAALMLLFVLITVVDVKRFF